MKFLSDTDGLIKTLSCPSGMGDSGNEVLRLAQGNNVRL